MHFFSDLRTHCAMHQKLFEIDQSSRKVDKSLLKTAIVGIVGNFANI